MIYPIFANNQFNDCYFVKCYYHTLAYITKNSTDTYQCCEFQLVAEDGFEPPTSRLWAWQATPALLRDMCLLLKKPRYITHLKKIMQAENDLIKHCNLSIFHNKVSKAYSKQCFFRKKCPNFIKRVFIKVEGRKML